MSFLYKITCVYTWKTNENSIPLQVESNRDEFFQNE